MTAFIVTISLLYAFGGALTGGNSMNDNSSPSHITNPNDRRNKRRARASWLAVVLLAMVATAGASPAYPLKASANGRYLVDSNNTPCLLTGDSPQALFVKLTEAEAGLFLTNRAARGFNSLWVNLLCSTNNGGFLNGQTTNGILPFTNTLAGTSYLDLTTPNEAFFAHVDRVINTAAQLGIQIMLDPLETSVGGWTATALANGTNRCRSYGLFLGNRYKNFNNLIWWSGNDFQDWTNPASDAVVRAVAQGIKDADTQHLHTLMLDYPVSSSLNNTNWLPILGLNASYTYWPTYAQVLTDYNRANFLPTFMAEAHYEGEILYEAYGTPEVLRRQEYWSLLSGACGQFMGNHFTWQFIAGWQTNLNTTGSLQMTNVKALFESRRWYDLVPDQNHTVVTAGYGTFASSGSLTNNNYATAARTADGALVMVYLPTVRTITVDMTKLSAPALAKWFDPASGAYSTIAGSPFINSSTRTFTPAGNNSGGAGDWVLVLEIPSPDLTPPIISDITNQTTSVGVPVGPIPFSISDAEMTATNLQLGADSSSPALVPTNNIIFGGSGSNRTVTVTPTAGLTGTATITMTVSDGNNSTNDTFVLTVTAASASQAGSFTNSGSVTYSANAAGSPYPSPITVSGLGSTVSGLVVRLQNLSLSNLNSTSTNKVDMLLVGPGGGKLLLLSDIGMGTSTSGVSLTFSNGAATFLPQSGPLAGGTYKPTDFPPAESFPSPAPAGPYATNLAVFTGQPANGVWSLYVVGGPNDVGNLAGGWTLTITTQTALPSAPTITSVAFLDATHLRLAGTGDANVSYTVQASTNLVTWQNLGGATADGGGLFEFVDTLVAGFALRFYRVSTP